MKAVVCGGGWVREPRAEVVECQLNVREKVTPPVRGEGVVGGGKCGDDVVLGGADVPFGGESAMVVGWGKLKVKVVCPEHRREVR